MSHIRNVPDPWDEFLDLLDVDETTYTGKAGQFARVNATPDGMEFTDDVLQKSGGTMTGNLILNADPVSNLGAATKQYVDNTAQGLDVKESCRVVTMANITLSGVQTIDGVSVIAGDRVLVKEQTNAEDNGIYVCASGAWSRATDADTDAEVTAGMFTFIEEGTVNADTGWVLSTNDPIVVGTTELTFVQFSGAGSYTAGNGLLLSGGEFSADFEDTNGNIAAVGTQDSGVSNKVARADHVHAHGDQAGGSFHAVAVAGVSAGFISAAWQSALEALPTIGSGTVTGQTLYWDGDSFEPSSVLFNDHANAEVGINTASPNATLHVNGSFSQAVTTQTGDYDLGSGTNEDVGTILHNNTAADNNITLPAAASSAGRVYHVKKISSGTYKTTILTAGADTIDGAASYELDIQYESVTLVCDGTNWHIV